MRLRCEVANYSAIPLSDLYGFPLIIDASNAFKPHWILSSRRLAVACDSHCLGTTVRFSNRERNYRIANFMPEFTARLGQEAFRRGEAPQQHSCGAEMYDTPMSIT